MNNYYKRGRVKSLTMKLNNANCVLLRARVYSAAVLRRSQRGTSWAQLILHFSRGVIRGVLFGDVAEKAVAELGGAKLPVDVFVFGELAQRDRGEIVVYVNELVVRGEEGGTAGPVGSDEPVGEGVEL